MSGLNAGAVASFNFRSQAQAYRIPCGIHSVHIAITKFEAEAFGKINKFTLNRTSIEPLESSTMDTETAIR